MKAIVQEKYGSPYDLALREVDRPLIGDDDVLVRVHAASVHPDVWHVVIGRPYVLRLMGAGFSKPKNPIPGTDMAGIVESVGKAVTRYRQGDGVFGETIATHQWTNGGAFAEYVSVREDWLALKPGNVTFEQAAAVPTSGFIALHNLRDASQVGPGRKVLINGAGGGVGALALQFAKAHGAHVTAVDSTNKLSMLRSLGADEGHRLHQGGLHSTRQPLRSHLRCSREPPVLRVYLRCLLTHGARAVLHAAHRRTKTHEPLTRLHQWALTGEARRGHNNATIAVANKRGRIVWAIWTRDVEFDPSPALPEAA
jgi:NADPH:quinone reductase-like Zn-dependent oxidoreductase